MCQQWPGRNRRGGHRFALARHHGSETLTHRSQATSRPRSVIRHRALSSPRAIRRRTLRLRRRWMTRRRSKRPKSNRARQRSIPTRPVSRTGRVRENDRGCGGGIGRCNRWERRSVGAAHRLRLIHRNDAERRHGDRGPQSGYGDGGDLRHAGTLTMDRRMPVIG